MIVPPRFTHAHKQPASIIVIALLALVSPPLAHAQDAPPEQPPAHLAAVEGSGFIDRDRETIEAVLGEVLLPGDRLRTESGRAELWFPDGSFLDVDSGSVLELQSESLIRLTAGRIAMTVSRPTSPSSPAVEFQIDTPAGSVAPNGASEFKVAVTGAPGNESIDVEVIRGSVELLADGGSVIVRSGERTFAHANGAPAPPQIFNSARSDAFDGWIAAQRDTSRGRPVSSQYLPPNLRMYGGAFDRDGAWDYEPAYGYVWYPTVAPGWRPYYNGYWRPLPRYGWTWIAGNSWGWPTHHYGRWGYHGARWFWIPERGFAPAWVSWASAANYVSWCPLGFDNRPVFGFSISVGNTWAGWTVLPRTHFGVRTAYVNRYAIEGGRLPRNTAFAVHSQAPYTPQFRGRADGQFRVRTDGQDRGGFRPTRPAQAGVAVPRSPQAGRYDGSDIRRGGERSMASAPASADVRTRADRRDPRTTVPYGSADRNDGSRYSGVTRRYRVPPPAPPSGNVTPRQNPTAPPTPTPPAAPEASGIPASQGQVMRRTPPPSDTGWGRPAQQNDSAWGRTAQVPPRPSASPDDRPTNRRESGASAPARESAPPSGTAGRAVPRGEGRSGSGSERAGGGNGNGGGGHGRR